MKNVAENEILDMTQSSRTRVERTYQSSFSSVAQSRVIGLFRNDRAANARHESSQRWLWWNDINFYSDRLEKKGQNCFDICHAVDAHDSGNDRGRDTAKWNSADGVFEKLSMIVERMFGAEQGEYTWNELVITD